MTVSTYDKHHSDSSPASGTAQTLKIQDISQWLDQGWKDFKSAPGASLLYGAIFSLVCLGITLLSFDYPGFTLTFLTGLMLIGPGLAVGTYTASRQLQNDEPVSIGNSLKLIRSRSANLAIFGILLALIMVAWVRLSSLIFAIKFEMISPSVEAYTSAMLNTPEGLVVLAYFIFTGFLLALAVFITSAISVPMIIDRNCDAFAAVQASYQLVMSNKRVMAAWAAVIVTLTGVGIASGFVAMTVLFPLLGYATWHSYVTAAGNAGAETHR